MIQTPLGLTRHPQVPDNLVGECNIAYGDTKAYSTYAPGSLGRYTRQIHEQRIVAGVRQKEKTHLIHFDLDIETRTNEILRHVELRLLREKIFMRWVAISSETGHAHFLADTGRVKLGPKARNQLVREIQQYVLQETKIEVPIELGGQNSFMRLPGTIGYDKFSVHRQGGWENVDVQEFSKYWEFYADIHLNTIRADYVSKHVYLLQAHDTESFRPLRKFEKKKNTIQDRPESVKDWIDKKPTGSPHKVLLKVAQACARYANGDLEETIRLVTENSSVKPSRIRRTVESVIERYDNPEHTKFAESKFEPNKELIRNLDDEEMLLSRFKLLIEHLTDRACNAKNERGDFERTVRAILTYILQHSIYDNRTSRSYENPEIEKAFRGSVLTNKFTIRKIGRSYCVKYPEPVFQFLLKEGILIPATYQNKDWSYSVKSRFARHVFLNLNPDELNEDESEELLDLTLTCRNLTISGKEKRRLNPVFVQNQIRKKIALKVRSSQLPSFDLIRLTQKKGIAHSALYHSYWSLSLLERKFVLEISTSPYSDRIYKEIQIEIQSLGNSSNAFNTRNPADKDISGKSRTTFPGLGSFRSKLAQECVSNSRPPGA